MNHSNQQQTFQMSHLAPPKLTRPKEMPPEVCEEMVLRLQEIMVVLQQDIDNMHAQHQQQRHETDAQLASERETVCRLSEENSQLREQVSELRHDKEQKRIMVATLSATNRQLVAQKSSLTSIVHYLEDKNRKIEEELFELRRSGSRTTTKKEKDTWNVPPSMVLQGIEMRSIYEYTDRFEADVRKGDVCMTEPYLQSARLLPQDDTITINDTTGNKSRQKSVAKERPLKHSKSSTMVKSQVSVTPLAKKNIKSRTKNKQSEPKFSSCKRMSYGH